MHDIKKLKEIAHELRVLYVEDELDIRLALGEYLCKIFSYVDIAEDGQDGLKYFQENDYDIVMTDIQMPYMNGLDMSLEIKSIKPEQEIIIISAYSETSYFIQTIRLGINGYILKPIDYEQMNMCLYKTAIRIVRFKENIEYKQHLEEMVQERTKEIISLEKDKTINYENTLLAFVGMVEDRDTYTGGHSLRVAKYSKLIAEKMEYSKEECELIYRAGILHDIGKIATPDSVLLKPGHLSGLEYKLIQEHVQVGYDLLCKIPMYKEISNIIIYHHERYDGAGYPNGVKGYNIPPLARIMIVADSFDAMTTNRIYKGRKNNIEAVEELKLLSGKQFHPEVVNGAIEVLLEVAIHDTITQLPNSDIEKERFAYFYRDQITGAYNTDYFEFILKRNSFEKEFNYINIIFLTNFTKYNKDFGWDQGNKMLNGIVDYLQNEYPSSIIFRFHGDDFIIMTKEQVEIDITKLKSIEVFEKSSIEISKLHIDLLEHDISDFKELLYFISTSN